MIRTRLLRTPTLLRKPDYLIDPSGPATCQGLALLLSGVLKQQVPAALPSGQPYSVFGQDELGHHESMLLDGVVEFPVVGLFETLGP